MRQSSRDGRGVFSTCRAVLAASLVFFACLPAVANDRAPNVLMIITDEHNFRTLGCYRRTMSREQAEMWGIGAVVSTPHIDRLAEEGVLCTRAYATSPVCSPCRAALLTGRYPHATGVPTNNMVLDRSIPTLADRLNKAGYRTTFIGKWHLAGSGKPEWAPVVDGGFQYKKFMFNRGHWKKFGINDGEPFVAGRNGTAPSYSARGADENSFSTDWLTQRAIEFIADAKTTKPFFAVVSYPDPHGPNTVRAPYDEMFQQLPFTPPRTYRSRVAKPKWVAERKHPIFRGNDMAAYFGMVKCLDDNVGRLVQQLTASKQLENTLIIMTSDHGDLCYEHDRQNKGNPYEGSARVPLIVRLPGRIAPGQYYQQPIGSVDVTPTIMGLLRRDGDASDQGRDLSQQLATTDEPHGADVPPVTFLRNAGQTARWVAAIDARFKLVISTNDEPWLLDSQQDPDELQNFFGRPRTGADSKRLALALREYGSRTNDPHLREQRIAESIDAVLAGEKAL